LFFRRTKSHPSKKQKSFVGLQWRVSMKSLEGLLKIQQVSHRFAVIASWHASENAGHKSFSLCGLAKPVEDCYESCHFQLSKDDY